MMMFLTDVSQHLTLLEKEASQIQQQAEACCPSPSAWLGESATLPPTLRNLQREEGGGANACQVIVGLWSLQSPL